MRHFINVCVLAIATSAMFIYGEENDMTATLSGKKALMIIAAEGFQDDEFSKPCNLLTGLGATVKVACSRREATGVFGREIKADLLLNECKADDYDAVIFVGGPGATEYFDNAQAWTLAREAVSKDKVLGAICIAPAILANAGILKGRKATSFPSEQGRLAARGAQVVRQNVVIDGQIVTAIGPQAAKEFAEALAKLLQ